MNVTLLTLLIDDGRLSTPQIRQLNVLKDARGRAYVLPFGEAHLVWTNHPESKYEPRLYLQADKLTKDPQGPATAYILPGTIGLKDMDLIAI